MASMYSSLSPSDFMFTRNFNFEDGGTSAIQEGIDAISAQFSGVLTSFWGALDPVSRDNKRNLILNLLVGWYLADMYPTSLTGITGNAGLPMVKKSIGGVDITFLQYKIQEEMKPFTTNTFGIRALMMLLTAPERFGMHGSANAIFTQPTSPVPPVMV